VPHKFKIGEVVALRSSIHGNVPDGIYEVTRQLPRDDDREFRYRIKSATEPHERVAREGELTKIANDDQENPA
jgi:hypothetical protein